MKLSVGLGTGRAMGGRTAGPAVLCLLRGLTDAADPGH